MGGYYSYKQSATDSSQVKIEKSRTNTILGTGPSVDGINHDYDRIFLWLSPTIDLTVEGDSINWKFLDGETAEITYIYAGYLNGHMEIPIGVWDIFRRHNISEQDFPDILSHDPLSTETSALDSARFEPINTSFPYIPPPRPTDPPQQMEYSIRDDLSSSSGTSTIQEHSVGASVGYTLNAYVVKAALKVDQSWTWSNISSSAGSAGTTQYASMTIGSPAFGYTGPVSVQAFYDTHFKTFAFDFIRDKPLALTGTVSAAGRPVPSKEVLLTAGDGVQYRTYTDQAGDYRFFGSYNVPVTVRSDNIAKSVARVGENARIDFSQPQ